MSAGLSSVSGPNLKTHPALPDHATTLFIFSPRASKKLPGRRVPAEATRKGQG